MDRDIAVPTSREQLWGLLAEAAEIVHHLMCCYLYAAFSLKEGLDEDLDEAELAAVQRWRQEILAVAIEEMGHLATVCNLLSATGAPAHLAHQNFPVAPGYHPAGVVVKLTPFNPQTLAHFIYLERPEDSDLADGAGFEPPRDYMRDSRMDRLMSVATDYATVGELYRSINLGLARLVESLGAERVFIGDPAHQLGAEVARLPGLKVVRCLKTAQIAITAIIEQGESAAATQEASHYQRFVSIQREYQALLQARPGFRPARMSAHNPVMRRPPTPEGKLWVTVEPAASLMDLGNALYNHSLRCLSLAYGGVDAATQRVLVQASIDLMHVLTPVATCLGTLAASPALPEATAGISFATLRDAAALLPGVASLDLLVERLEEMRTRCGELVPRHADVAPLLEATCAGLGHTVARLVRAQFRSLRESDFVMAARSLGYSDTRIIVQEILPNALPPIIVTASVMVANAILIEAGLSFLNMRDANLVSWGGMIGNGRDLLRTAWYLSALPGIAIALAVLSLNLVGDGLNEILNPRSDPR